jgi:hypothetical protein
MKEESYTSTPPMGRTACTELQCLYKGELNFFTLPTSHKLDWEPQLPTFFFSFDRLSLILFSCPKLCAPLCLISHVCALCMLCYHSDNCDNIDNKQGQVTWSQPFRAVHNAGSKCAARCVSSNYLPSSSSSHSKVCCYSTLNTFSE